MWGSLIKVLTGHPRCANRLWSSGNDCWDISDNLAASFEGVTSYRDRIRSRTKFTRLTSPQANTHLESSLLQSRSDQRVAIAAATIPEMLPGGNGPQHLGHATFQVLLAHLWFQLPTAEVGRSLLLDGLTVMIAPSNPSDAVCRRRARC